MGGNMDGDSLLNNFFSILEIRLLTLLQQCPQELRNEAKINLANTLSQSGTPDYGLDENELAACANLLELPTMKRSKV